MKTENTPSLAEFFGWSHHPFADTRPLPEPFLSPRDQSFLRTAGELLARSRRSRPGRSRPGRSCP
ncbi:MAG: hypothetical protein KA419_14000 [Acidobacteria bacterium]|nr:hypothetical protein [Acidobacteriota bacterium]